VATPGTIANGGVPGCRTTAADLCQNRVGSAGAGRRRRSVAPVPGRRHRSPSSARLLVALGGTTALSAGLGLMFVAVVLAPPAPPASCVGSPAIALAAAGPGTPVGATEYGGPGDPASGSVGASGTDLAANPDSYAELGGPTFQTATALGGLPYMTPLRISWGHRSAIAYKRDIGLGGAPIGGRPRVIDLWWQLAAVLGIPYEDGRWSGVVRLSLPPAGGAAAAAAIPAAVDAAPARPACATDAASPVSLTPGSRAQLLPDGQATVPAGAPAAVRGIIAAGNQIVGKPYVYGAGHGLPLDEIAPAYDCSSSVEHLMYGGGLLPVGYGAASGALESFGQPGPGRWVTIYASADHVFMYVAGLRWDTHDAAGPGDGSAGIGWHPLVRDAAGFVARHPVGL
jgi:cell wall-associated NlpC family hydrolase